MKIYFFTHGSINLASARTRVYIVSDKLCKVGIKTKIFKIKMRTWKNLSLGRLRELIFYFKVLFCIKKKDKIYLQKILSFDFVILILFFRIVLRKRYYYDFDDAIFLFSKRVNLKTKILCKLAEGVIVGSHYLQEYALKYNKNVIIIPTSVDTNKYFVKRDKKQNLEIVIGWLGNASVHYENLKLLVPVFEKIINEGGLFKFILVGSVKDEKILDLFKISGLNIQFIDSLNWGDTDEIVRVIQSFDIGLMPLVDNDWNKGKCSFKAIEYMACGIPTIVSPVGENNFLIKNGTNGFFAENEIIWIDKIKQLISNEQLRQSFGDAGRDSIIAGYSYKANIPRLLNFLKI